MYDLAILWDWLAFAVRWLHVITGIAWIGASFYFIALDLGLRKAAGMPQGAYGEEWEVHGGGFYHTTKYLVAPDRLPEHLTWHKWQSYWTWLSGAALLAIVYWAGAELFLIDPAKADLATWQAIVISAAFIAVGWIGYDLLCKSPLKSNATAVMAVLFAGIVLASWSLNQIFTGRAALLHLGAMTATIMTANVFFIIMPNQRIVIADLKAGRQPHAKYGQIAKLRSMHNNYLTLPVLFLMLSNHYPLAFGTEYAWIIACLVFLTGVTIRHYFNTLHATGQGPVWTWGATAVLMVVMAWLSTFSSFDGDYDAVDAAPITPQAARYAEAEGFEAAANVVLGRCSMCHAREPNWAGMHWAPKGVHLETPQDIAAQARQVYLQAAVTHAMPPANITGMTPEERAILRGWARNAGLTSVAGLR